MRLIKLLILISLVSIHSCVDSFLPETAKYDNILFIECLLSNDTAKNQIAKISYSGAIITEAETSTSGIPQYVTGAEVKVVRDDQESYTFKESSQGQYVATNLVPEVGRAYQLVVVFDGNIFESEFETMLESPPIDSITFIHQVDKMGEMGDYFDGYRFNVSNHRDQPGPSYYRWECEGTYLFRVPHSATHIWDGRNQIVASNDNVRTCWKSKVINEVFIGSSEGLSEDKIIETPLNFESQMGNALSIRYSLLVKQMALTKPAWTFWSDMLRQVNQNGGMFDTQPFRIKGNISCTTDPDLFVAGIFEVAGYSEKRIFINQPTEFTVYPESCPLDTIPTIDFAWYMLPVGSFIVFEEESQAFFFSSPQCFDCTKKGGSLEKPAFWKNGI